MPLLEPPFPEQMRDAFCRLLEDVPADEVLRFAKVEKSLLQGARPVAASVPVIRGNIRKVLRSPKAFPPSFRDFLAHNSLHQRVVCVLSPHALKEALSDLEVYFHGRHLIASLLLDDREEVQRLGLERMEAGALATSAPSEDERTEAAERLSRKFDWFLSELRALIAMAGEDGKSVPAPTQAKVDAFAKKVAELESALRHEQGQTSKVRGALEDKLADSEQRRDASLKHIERLRKDLEAAGQKQSGVERELTALRAELEQRVRDDVKRELDARRSPWMPKVQGRDAEVTRAQESSADLLARVEQVLAKQAESDRHHGNRETLERRLREVEHAQERVETARQQALHPLSALDGLAVELRREVVRLQAQLVRPVNVSTYDDLLARINAVDSAESLTTLRSFVEQGAELGVWDRAHLRALYLAIDHRFSLLLDLFADHNKMAALRRHPLALVRRAMAGEDCCSVFVDGHNLAHVVYEEHFARGGKDAEARRLLRDDLVRLFLDAGEVMVRLYFDGPQWSEESLSLQVKCIFSGGQGAHRADKVILEDVSGRLNADADASCIVVSNDRDLLAQASQRGAIAMRAAEFAALLA